MFLRAHIYPIISSQGLYIQTTAASNKKQYIKQLVEVSV